MKDNSFKFFNKGISTPVGIIVIVVAAVIAGALMWWLGRSMTEQPIPALPTPSPTADATAGWKTYRNDEYGFELKYPKEWEEKWEEVWEKNWVAEVGSEESLYFHNPLRCEFGEIRPPCGVVINVYNNPESLSPIEWADQYIELKPIDLDHRGNEDSIYIVSEPSDFYEAQELYDEFLESGQKSLKQITINGSEGIKFSKRSNRHRVVEQSVILSKGNLIYEFITSEQVSNLPVILNQMLSTFKFLE